MLDLLKERFGKLSTKALLHPVIVTLKTAGETTNIKYLELKHFKEAITSIIQFPVDEEIIAIRDEVLFAYEKACYHQQVEMHFEGFAACTEKELSQTQIALEIKAVDPYRIELLTLLLKAKLLDDEVFEMVSSYLPVQTKNRYLLFSLLAQQGILTKNKFWQISHDYFYDWKYSDKLTCIEQLITLYKTKRFLFLWPARHYKNKIDSKHFTASLDLNELLSEFLPAYESMVMVLYEHKLLTVNNLLTIKKDKLNDVQQGLISLKQFNRLNQSNFEYMCASKNYTEIGPAFKQLIAHHLFNKSTVELVLNHRRPKAIAEGLILLHQAGLYTVLNINQLSHHTQPDDLAKCLILLNLHPLNGKENMLMLQCINISFAQLLDLFSQKNALNQTNFDLLIAYYSKIENVDDHHDYANSLCFLQGHELGTPENIAALMQVKPRFFETIIAFNAQGLLEQNSFNLALKHSSTIHPFIRSTLEYTKLLTPQNMRLCLKAQEKYTDNVLHDKWQAMVSLSNVLTQACFEFILFNLDYDWGIFTHIIREVYAKLPKGCVNFIEAVGYPRTEPFNWLRALSMFSEQVGHDRPFYHQDHAQVINAYLKICDTNNPIHAAAVLIALAKLNKPLPKAQLELMIPTLYELVTANNLTETTLAMVQQNGFNLLAAKLLNLLKEYHILTTKLLTLYRQFDEESITQLYIVITDLYQRKALHCNHLLQSARLQFQFTEPFYSLTPQQNDNELSFVIEENTLALAISKDRLKQLGMTTLVEKILYHGKLKKLDLSDCKMGIEAAQQLTVLIQQDTSLEVLYLNDNQLGDDGVGMLVGALLQNKQSHLKELYLSRNKLGERGATQLANYLATNPALEVLNLACNDLTLLGQKVIADALLSNDHLQRLNLSHTDGGFQQDVFGSYPARGRYELFLKVIKEKTNLFDLKGIYAHGCFEDLGTGGRIDKKLEKNYALYENKVIHEGLSFIQDFMDDKPFNGSLYQQVVKKLSFIIDKSGENSLSKYNRYSEQPRGEILIVLIGIYSLNKAKLKPELKHQAQHCFRRHFSHKLLTTAAKKGEALACNLAKDVKKLFMFFQEQRTHQTKPVFDSVPTLNS